MKQFFIQTLGCKVNQFESDAIAIELEKQGWIQVADSKQADVLIVNTCAVTSKAGMQSRQTIRKIIRENPDAKVLVTGCHAQTEPELIRKIENVTHVVSNADKNRIARHILDLCDADFEFSFKPADHTPAHKFKSFKETVYGRMTRAYLKIQDGCNAFCTYCIVPHARGSSVSMPQNEVMQQLSALHEKGFKEVILSGIHIGLYGLDLKPSLTLTGLLEKINARKPVHRIRISSIEPAELTSQIIKLAEPGNIICDHFHVPLQSGDDGILTKMKRPYTSATFEKVINNIHEVLPDAGIGVDTLIGFPGEDDAAFENTYKLMEKLPITYLHVFPFSPRKGTPAFHFKSKVPSDVIKERCARMRELDKQKRMNFIMRQMGKPLEALVQNTPDKKTGLLEAITSNYLSVLIENREEYKGKIVNLTYDRYDDSMNLFGYVC